jgi:hypothetical protein
MTVRFHMWSKVIRLFQVPVGKQLAHQNLRKQIQFHFYNSYLAVKTDAPLLVCYIHYYIR